MTAPSKPAIFAPVPLKTIGVYSVSGVCPTVIVPPKRRAAPLETVTDSVLEAGMDTSLMSTLEQDSREAVTWESSVTVHVEPPTPEPPFSELIELPPTPDEAFAAVALVGTGVATDEADGEALEEALDEATDMAVEEAVASGIELEAVTTAAALLATLRSEEAGTVASVDGVALAEADGTVWTDAVLVAEAYKITLALHVDWPPVGRLTDASTVTKQLQFLERLEYPLPQAEVKREGRLAVDPAI